MEANPHCTMATSEEMWEWGGPLEETLRPRRRNSRSEDESERGEAARPAVVVPASCCYVVVGSRIVYFLV